MRGRSTAAARLAAAALAAAGLAAPAGAQGTGLTSAPYDLSLFRDGETRRMRARYGRWTAVCDEIIRLRSRYCSLSAPVEDAAGRTVARLDVATDEAGRPAALLRLPHGTLFSRPITLARPGAPPRALRATICDADGCSAVWAPDAGEVAALGRNGLALAYLRTARADLPASALRPADVEAVAGTVPSGGFADAVAASMRAGPLDAAPVRAGPPDAASVRAGPPEGAGMDGLGLRR